MNPDLLHILQHALGCNRHGQNRSGNPVPSDGYGAGRFYRNRFVTDADSPDGRKCQELVAQGLMTDCGARAMCAGMHVYMVTAAGIQAMDQHSPKAPKLSRGQQRYRSYLRSDSGLSFGEWLKHRRYALS